MYASTFVIVSPTDYQNILAELRSPVALHSDTQFLEPELPVTPNLFPVHHQDCLYVKTDLPLLPGSQPLPWTPQTEPISRGQVNPLRPCELVLPVPAFELPDPLPPEVKKPHIALNDQLLLSEEEDRLYQEMELSCKTKSHPHLAVCELDTDMTFSTSSPSLTSIASITPSSPDRPGMAGRRQTCVLMGKQVAVGSKESKKNVKMEMEMEKVAGIVTTELEGNAKKFLKLDFFKNVDRKCEMITKDRSEWADAETNALLEQGEKEKHVVMMKGGGSHVEVREVHNRPEAQLIPAASDFRNNKIKPLIVTEVNERTLKGERFEGGSEVNVCQGGKMGAVDLQLEDKEQFSETQSDACLISEGDVVAEGCIVARLFPQAWGDHHSQLGSTEEEEDGDEELTGGLLLEVVEKGQGTEGEKELKGVIEVRLEESFNQVEQTEKEVLSLVGWHSDSSSVNVEPPTPGRSVSSDLLDRRER